MIVDAEHDLCLGDVCRIEHGYAFKGEYMREVGNGPIVVNIGNFRYHGGFRFESTRIQRYTGEFSDRYRLMPGECLLVMTCQTPGGEILGIPARIPDDGSSYLHNQRLGRVVITDSGRLDLDFAYYLFLSPAFNRYLVQTATGSKILHTAPERIERFRFSRPPLDHQRRIGSALRTLDDLIDNNIRRIRVLETLARSRWADFVRSTEFELMRVGVAIDAGGGTTPSRAIGDYWCDDFADIDWYTPSDLTRGKSVFATSSAERLSQTTADKCGLRVYPKGSVMMTSRATIGVVAINTKPACTNQGFIVCVPSARLPTYVLYHWMLSMVDEFKQMATGSTFKELTRGTFRNMNVPVPSLADATAFQKSVEPCYDLLLNLQRRNATLRALRDHLLPRLLSGELDVSRLPLPPDEPVAAPSSAPPPPPAPLRRGRRPKEPT